VIWLHGLGADGNDFAPIVPELGLPSTMPLRFLFPHAPSIPVTINNGYVMPAWYDITSFDMNQRIDAQGLSTSIARLHALIALEEKRGIPSEKIVLAGFSQGAVVALATGLRFAKPLAGILALSGYLPFSQNQLAESPLTPSSLPIFLGHGTEDNIVPYSAGLLAYDTLQQQGFAVDWHRYPMSHGVCEAEIKDIARWLKTIFC
jgi:phospholipase/carboxylesterase